MTTALKAADLAAGLCIRQSPLGFAEADGTFSFGGRGQCDRDRSAKDLDNKLPENLCA